MMRTATALCSSSSIYLYMRHASDFDGRQTGAGSDGTGRATADGSREGGGRGKGWVRLGHGNSAGSSNTSLLGARASSRCLSSHRPRQ